MADPKEDPEDDAPDVRTDPVPEDDGTDPPNEGDDE